MNAIKSMLENFEHKHNDRRRQPSGGPGTVKAEYEAKHARLQTKAKTEGPPAAQAYQGDASRQDGPAWAQVTKRRSAPPPKLHEGLWDIKAKIIQAGQLVDYDFKSPVVVSCATTEECDNARKYYAARGSPIGATFVDLSRTCDKVMITGATGPRLADAAVKEEKVDAPKRRALPQGARDDQSLPSDGGEAAYLRITIAKAFSRRELYNKAKARPQCLPALVVRHGLLGKILATRAAIAYEDEITCLIMVQKGDVALFSDASQVSGAFIMTHKEKAAPR